MLDDTSTLSLVLLGVLLVLSAFFSGSEAALLAVQRVRIQALVNGGSAAAARVAQMTEHPERLLPPILLGNNLVNTAVAAIATTVAIALLRDEGQAVIVATAAVTAALLVFGETIPKTVAARNPERAAIILSLPVRLVSLLLLPASYVLQAISSGVARVVGGRPRSAVTEEEIKTMVSLGRQAGAVEEEEEEMIRRVFEAGDRRVREVMTPRPEIVWVEEGASTADFLRLYAAHPHTRFPVRSAASGDVAGMVSVKDVMQSLAAGAPLDTPVTNALREVHFVPETKPARDLLAEMQAMRQQMAIVADEFGDVAGLVTLRRLVEGIVGSTSGADEPHQEAEVVPMGAGAFEVDAGLSIAEANERLGLQLPTGEYDTIAGLVMEALGRVPEVGASATVAGRVIRVAEMRGVRIERVLISGAPGENSPA